MTLYQEIIWLQTFFKGKWCVKNVIPYYKPLIEPSFKIDRHFFWASDFILTPKWFDDYTNKKDNIKAMADSYNYDLDVLKSCNVDCRLVLRNLVVPEIGKYIFENLTK